MPRAAVKAVEAVDVHADQGDVFDLDALAREANQVPFEFRFGGEVYTCPGELDIRVVSALGAGDLEGALQRMLGDDQWQRMLASPQVLTAPMLLGVLREYSEHSGVELPNLSASTGSSGSTARR